MSSPVSTTQTTSTTPPMLTERLSIPYFLFTQNPTRTIKQLLGQNITIHSFTTNSIITNDETLIVDVNYSSIPFSLLKIYYIETSSLKKLMPNSEKYIVTINGCNIKISSPKLKDFPRLLPIRIKPTLTNNYSSSGQLDTQFSYYGTTVTSPMNSLCTPLKYINHQFEPFRTEPIEPLYPPDFKSNLDNQIKSNLDALINENINHYKQAISTFYILASVDHVVSTTNFSECKLGTTGYVIPFEQIPLTQDINGIILIQPKRIPNYVLFFPTKNFTICSEELMSIKDFLTQDAINFYNFIYVRDVVNKSG